MEQVVCTQRSWSYWGGLANEPEGKHEAVSAAKDVREKERELKFILHARDGQKAGEVKFQ